ncbi:hypothetical protein ES702_03416 [subsurface metagenome]
MVALVGRGIVSEMSELRCDVAVVDEVDGESGGVGNVFAKSAVSIRASASKLISGTSRGNVLLTSCGP